VLLSIFPAEHLPRARPLQHSCRGQGLPPAAGEEQVSVGGHSDMPRGRLSSHPCHVYHFYKVQHRHTGVISPQPRPWLAKYCIFFPPCQTPPGRSWAHHTQPDQPHPQSFPFDLQNRNHCSYPFSILQGAAGAALHPDALLGQRHGDHREAGCSGTGLALRRAVLLLLWGPATLTAGADPLYTSPLSWQQDHCFYQGSVQGYADSAVSISTCSGLR